MRIVEMDRVLTQEELEGVRRADKYLNNWGDFAMVAENVFVVLGENVVSKGVEEACREVEEKINEFFGQVPDFTTFLMDDGHMLLLLGENVGVFSKQEISTEDYEEKEFIRSIALRAEAFEACERKSIIALVDIQ